MNQLTMNHKDDLNSRISSEILVKLQEGASQEESPVLAQLVLEESPRKQGYTINVEFWPQGTERWQMEFFLHLNKISLPEEPFLIQTNWKSIFAEHPIMEYTLSVLRAWITQKGFIELDLDNEIAHLCCDNFIEKTTAHELIYSKA